MRKKEQFIGMSKTSAVSQLQSLKDSILHGPPHYNMTGLEDENILTWLWKNLRNLGNSHCDYRSYTDPVTNNGLFKIPDTTEIALLSDWASDTDESHRVAAQVGTKPYSIHMGDTYYVGNEKEIAYNFQRDKGTWPYGSLGSFAMIGNHEMYSSGEAYFATLLPYMGFYGDDSVRPVPVTQVQQSSYFCLENDHWRIIALDTGYWSLKGWLGLDPNENLDLHDQQKAWLRDIVKMNDDKRGLVILSHHQCFSAFEQEFPLPGKTVSNLLEPGRDILWLWGHEHWFSVYGPNKLANGSNVFARCIGNSGMPVELDKDGIPKAPKNQNHDAVENRNLVLFDNRVREKIDEGIRLGHNGYATLTLNGPKLTIAYFDDNGGQPVSRKTLEEQWETDPATGSVKGVSITDLTAKGNDPLYLWGGTWERAILP